MAVKIKLKRLGKIREPYYRIVVADARTKRDGRAIEEIGKYHPKTDPSFIEVNSERVQHWLSVGAQPTDPVRVLLKITGDWQKFTGEPGAEGTLRTAAPREDRKERFAAAARDSQASQGGRREGVQLGPGRLPDRQARPDKGRVGQRGARRRGCGRYRAGRDGARRDRARRGRAAERRRPRPRLPRPRLLRRWRPRPRLPRPRLLRRWRPRPRLPRPRLLRRRRPRPRPLRRRRLRYRRLTPARGLLLRNPGAVPDVLEEALDHLVRGIVQYPDEVQVRSRVLRRGNVLEVRVHPDDLGKVIGRGGRTARALRTVIGALAAGRYVRIDLLDASEVR